MDDQINTMIESLGPTAASKASVIALARLGTAAEQVAPALLRLCIETEDRGFMRVCLDALGSVLRGSMSPIAEATAMQLAQLMLDAKYRHIRRRIVFTINRIGRAALYTLPTLLGILKAGTIGSVRVPLRGTIIRIAWLSFTDGSEEEQATALAAISKFWLGYKCWLFESLLKDGLGSKSIRAQIAMQLPDLQRRYKKLMDEFERQCEKSRLEFMQRNANLFQEPPAAQ